MVHELKFFTHQSTCKKPEVIFFRTVEQAQVLYVEEDGIGSIDPNHFEVDQVLKSWLECHDCRAKRTDVSMIEGKD